MELDATGNKIEKKRDRLIKLVGREPQLFDSDKKAEKISKINKNSVGANDPHFD